MPEVIDVITRLVYEANTAGLDKSYAAIEKQIDAIGEEMDYINRAEALKAKVAKEDINRQNQLGVAIENRRKRIGELTAAINREIQSNDKLKVSMMNQFGTYDTLIKKQNQLRGSTNTAGMSLVDLGRIAQDAPFGFIAIQNNINPLIDSFQRLVVETGSVGKAITAMKGALVGVAGLGFAISIITSALTIYSLRQQGVTSSTTEAERAIKKYTEALDNAEESARSASTSEVARINVLTSIAADVTQSERNRELAIRELQKVYPGYFGNLDKEILLQGKAKDAIDSATQALLARAAATAAEKKFAAASEQVYDLTLAQATAIERQINAQQRLDGLRKGRDSGGVDPQTTGAMATAIRQQELIANSASKSVKQISKDLDQARKDQNRFLFDAKEFAKQAGETIFNRDTLNDPKVKKEKADAVKRLIVPIGKDDFDELGNDIKYGTERVDIAMKAFEKMLFDRQIAVSDDDPFKKYSEHLKRGLTSIEMGILESISPGTSDEQADALFASIRDMFIRNETRLDNLRDQLRKLRGQKELTDEEKLQKQILELKLHYVEIGVDLLNQTISSAVSIANQIIQIEIDKNNRIIEIQERRVNEATILAERGNAEILKDEQERLNEATRAREQAARKQVQLNALMGASNSALALTEAIKGILAAASTTAAEGGGIVGYIAGIVAGLAAVAALYASIRSAADAGFHDGGHTGHGDEWEPAGTVHRDEFVFNKKATNRLGVPFLEALHEGRLNPYTATISQGSTTTVDNRKELREIKESIDGLEFSADQKVDEYGVHQMVQTTMRHQKRLWS